MAEISGNESIVVLGVRKDESEERKRTLSRHATGTDYYYRQSANSNRKLFCPIVDLDTPTVWEGLFTLALPKAIDVYKLGHLYKQAGGECPVIREAQETPCGQGRFGCWTCTVIRKDKAVINLVDEGYTNLRPLLEFRDWLASIRNDVKHRCTVRRNGVHGLGPFRLKTRKEILRRLLVAQQRSRLLLIKKIEIKNIHALWLLDKQNPFYFEDAS